MKQEIVVNSQVAFSYMWAVLDISNFQIRELCRVVIYDFYEI